MNKAKEISSRNELITLVRKVAKLWNETDEGFWKEYIADILAKDRETALKCFRDLAEQSKWIREK